MLALILAPPLLASHAINTSLATVPCAYFGGNYRHRGDENINMLAKMRLVMIEKWEGPCWQPCLANPASPACQASCGVENHILDTHARIKAINPQVASVLYWNTLLAFPFYTAVGKFAAANALAIDSTTKRPMQIRCDGPHGKYLTPFVYGYDTEAGVQLYIDTVKNLSTVAGGVIDGFFGDKWDFGATQTAEGQWQICNHGDCGNLTAAQAAAWTAGKRKALAAVTAYVGDGPYASNGVFGNFEGVGANFKGHAGNDAFLKDGDPRDTVARVNFVLSNHTYHFMPCAGDQKWEVDPNARSSLVSQCSHKQLVRFLLAVEPGCLLGTNGWSPLYDLPLGDPLAPAAYTPANGTSPATLNRSFASGTSVVFTYDAAGTGGTGVISWAGGGPPTPAPAHKITCGVSTSSELQDTSYKGANLGTTVATTVSACCAKCDATPTCAAWAFHNTTQQCHVHGHAAVKEGQEGTTAGRLDGRAA